MLQCLPLDPNEIGRAEPKTEARLTMLQYSFLNINTLDTL